MPELLSLAEIHAARERLCGIAVRTPLVRLARAHVRLAGFPELADSMPDLYLKDESAQPIGSFKLRGAYNMVAQLAPDELRRGVITYSSGNHAQGVAFAARALGSKAVIVMPENAPRIKREATAALGAEIVVVGPASSERRAKAEELAALHGYTVVPPYDDNRIIAGQATCGLEILEQLGWPDAPGIEETLVLSPVSGGGLLSGLSAGIKLTCSGSPIRAPKVFGCEPELAGDAHESFITRTLVEWTAEQTSRTLCDGLRTQSLGQRNFDHILRFTDGILTVTEAEIRAALRVLLHASRIVPEPSGAVSVAAALFHSDALPRARRVVAVVSGGNLDPALRAQLQAEQQEDALPVGV